MKSVTYAALSLALLIASMAGGSAQAQNPGYPYGPVYPPSWYGPPLPAPPAWSWDPYTSGLGVCPQRESPSDPPCSEMLPPTYGQPNYWPRR